jgi:CMP-N-acetylneuraminic acid synthetase
MERHPVTPMRRDSVIVIPARGGSKGIPRKNLRLLGGRPLLAYAIDAARQARCAAQVIVSTDDDEIATTGAALGAQVHRRPRHLAGDEIILDPVVLDALQAVPADLESIVTVQPTCPFVTAATIDAVRAAMDVGPANCAFTVIDDTHLAWGAEDGRFVPLYERRQNRQYLPKRLKETGGVVCVRRAPFVTSGTRFNPPFAPVEVTRAEALDIDDHLDWAQAEAQLACTHITLVAGGAGAVERLLKLANGLARHRVDFAILGAGLDRVRAQNYPGQSFENASALRLTAPVAVLDASAADRALISASAPPGVLIVTSSDGDHGAPFRLSDADPDRQADELNRLVALAHRHA